MLQKLRNILTGAAGGDAPASLAEMRMQICRQCPHKRGGRGVLLDTPESCAVCGCFLEWKTRVRAERCPPPEEGGPGLWDAEGTEPT